MLIDAPQSNQRRIIRRIPHDLAQLHFIPIESNVRIASVPQKNVPKK
jgi:hypothetical protein